VPVTLEAPPQQLDELLDGHLIPATEDSPIFASLRFVRERWPVLLAVSAILTVPCFWHRHLEAGDLASHTYNAWLVQLIGRGQAQGLWVKNVWENVLFDWMLSGLGSIFGLGLGEKIAVAVVVLVFFWGTFAFAAAVSRAAPWTLAPAMAMLAYGWTFQAGFFNYYLSIGLSFLALSVFYATGGRARLSAFLFTPLMLLAHPLGLLWFLGAAAYLLIAENLPQYLRVHLPAASGLLLILLHRFLWRHFSVGYSSDISFYALNGLDQMVVYRHRYGYLAAGLFLFMAACFLWDLVTHRKERGYWNKWALPLQLYIVVEVGALLLPGLITLPIYQAPLSLLLERFSLVAAILLLALFGSLQRRIWHLAGFGLFAFIFFGFLYIDTGRLSAMETGAERLVSALPFGTRVIATIKRRPDAPIYFIDHIVDRACIRRCFSFDNYEPASGQFRVRARPGNGIVTADSQESFAMEGGRYIVKPGDLPMYELYQCVPFGTDLCMRSLVAGEKSGPPPSP